MKEVKLFKENEEIPESAKFLQVLEDVNNDFLYAYEVKISKKVNQEEKKDLETIERVITYLNKRTGGQYTAKNKATVKSVTARLNEGVKPEDFKVVIDNMWKAWSNDEKMRPYLTPQTLFGNKFYNYLKFNSEEGNEEDAFNELEAINKKVLDEKRGL